MDDDSFDDRRDRHDPVSGYHVAHAAWHARDTPGAGCIIIGNTCYACSCNTQNDLDDDEGPEDRGRDGPDDQDDDEDQDDPFEATAKSTVVQNQPHDEVRGSTQKALSVRAAAVPWHPPDLHMSV